MFGSPQHQYTRALLDSLALARDHRRGSSLKVIGGAPPKHRRPPDGLPFPSPLSLQNDKNLCESTMPALESAGQRTHQFACHPPGPTQTAPREPRKAVRPPGAGGVGGGRGAAALSHARGGRRPRSRLRIPRPTARRWKIKAVDDVSFAIRRGESFGLVGESGSGKSTVARNVVRLIEPSAGQILFDGQDLMRLSRPARCAHPLRRRMQIVFQDPRSSLDPRIRVGELLAEAVADLPPLGQAEANDKQRLSELMHLVGLHERDLQKYPHEFSGGQLQRVAIARALTLGRRTSSSATSRSPPCDVSVQAQIVNLLDDLQDEFGLGVPVRGARPQRRPPRVRPDRGHVPGQADGALAVRGPLLQADPPVHPGACSARSRSRTRVRTARASAPWSRASRPTRSTRRRAASSITRCPRATDVCKTVEPPLTRYADGHLAACHHPLNVTEAEIASSERSDASPESAGAETPLRGLEPPTPIRAR